MDNIKFFYAKESICQKEYNAYVFAAGVCLKILCMLVALASGAIPTSNANRYVPCARNDTKKILGSHGRNGSRWSMKQGDYRDAYYEQVHIKNLPYFKKIAEKVKNGQIKLIDVRMDKGDFGHERITIFIHSEEQ